MNVELDLKVNDWNGFVRFRFGFRSIRMRPFGFKRWESRKPCVSWSLYLPCFYFDWN